MKNEDQNTQVNIESLASLAGLPLDLVKKELFENADCDNVSLEEIRAAMTKYIDKAMID